MQSGSTQQSGHDARRDMRRDTGISAGTIGRYILWALASLVLARSGHHLLSFLVAMGLVLSLAQRVVRTAPAGHSRRVYDPTCFSPYDRRRSGSRRRLRVLGRAATRLRALRQRLRPSSLIYRPIDVAAAYRQPDGASRRGPMPPPPPTGRRDAGPRSPA
jgi:hypothetical protein